jgi:zinc protease
VKPVREAIGPDIEVSEVDGVPLLHLPLDGPTTVALAFGVGRADEPPHRGGMTHLAEHVVMTSLSDRALVSSAHTELLRTVFQFRGAPGEAAAFLHSVASAVADLPLDHLGDEVEVLRTEQAVHGGSGLGGRLAWYRFGATGLGSVVLPELFLRNPDPDVLRAWVAERFTSDNAVVWVAGEVPTGLAVPLLRGARRPEPPTRQINGLRTPTLVTIDGLIVAASHLVERTVAASTGFRIAEHRLARRLRLERGLAYDVGLDYLPIGRRSALVTIGATCLDRHVDEVETALLEVLDDLAFDGPTDGELALELERLRDATNDAAQHEGRLDAAASDVLLGAPSQPLGLLVTAQAALDAITVADAMRQALRSMILLVPRGARRPDRPLYPYPLATAASIGEATVFHAASTGVHLPWQKRDGPTLAVGTEGVAMEGPSGARTAAVRWVECVAVVAEPDGRRVIFGADGYTIGVDPRAWRAGDRAVALIDRYGSRERFV